MYVVKHVCVCGVAPGQQITRRQVPMKMQMMMLMNKNKSNMLAMMMLMMTR